MFGIPVSVLVFAVLVLALGTGLFTAAQLIPQALRAVVSSFWCPFRRRDVTVEFQEDPVGRGRYLDVERCTAFDPSVPITCGKQCRYLGEFAAPRGVRGHEE